MAMQRRRFLGLTSAAGLGFVTGSAPLFSVPEAEEYCYRVAFGLWINDVRNEPMPLDNWPCGAMDDKTVDGIVRALDVQSESGYTAIDLAGLWTTYGWPADVDRVVDKDRRRRIHQIIKAAHEREIKVICFPSGILNWGFDEILAQHAELQTDNKHVMNPIKDASWQWLYRVFEYAADNYDVDGFHLEAADQGRCKTRKCMEQWPGDVAYFTFVTGKLADHLRKHYPGKLLITTVQGFSTWGKGFTPEETTHIVELSKKVDCIFDQGHRGTYVPQPEWKGFIAKLHCAYGTSGGIWVYPPQRWERSRWFLPYTQRTGKSLKDLYDAGGRGAMYYQGPVVNPSAEVNMAFGGRMLTNIRKSTEEVLSVTLEHLYRPRSSAALSKLVAIYLKAEHAYFDQWSAQRILATQKVPEPGELNLTNLFGATPGAATYLMEPFLDTEGRRNYKQGLIEALKDTVSIENEFNDQGRIARIKQAICETLLDINNIAISKGETKVWDDSQVGLKF